jgi:hypothetical protein
MMAAAAAGAGQAERETQETQPTATAAPTSIPSGTDGSQDTSPDTTRDANGNTSPCSDPADRFRVAVTPYGWLPGFSGDLVARGVEFDVNASFNDILDGSDSALGLMGAIDFEVDRLVFQINGAWVSADLGGTRGVLRNGEVRGELEFDAAWTEAFAGLRLVDESVGDWGSSHNRTRLTLDGFVGVRVTSIDVDTTTTATTTITLPDGFVLMPGQTRRQSQSEAWVEPFLGARLGYDLGNGWSAAVRCDVGGFGVDGSHFSWQAEALAGYRWDLGGWDIGLFAGYRALGQDYSSGDFAWDVVTHGPVIGTQIVFRF